MLIAIYRFTCVSVCVCVIIIVVRECISTSYSPYSLTMFYRTRYLCVRSLLLCVGV